MKTPRIPLALEGVPFIALAAFATLVAALLGYAAPAAAGLGLCFFCCYFFRDPVRIAPDDEAALVSPADGKVIIVSEVDDQRYLGGRARKISIFMNVFNVHVNRAPCAGRVEAVIHTPGRFFAADSPKAALENETCAVVTRSASGEKIAFVQMAGLIARRIVCWAEKGDTLARGQRFGLIRFGSRVDLYLPLTAKITVSIGDRVTAGETVIGYLEQ